MNAALLIIGLTMAGALALGLRAGRGREMTLEQWSVGGRGFGTIFVFLLLAGEIYTTFTFLGASGYAYGRGAPTYYILGYGCLAYILSYWLLPLIWRYAKDNRPSRSPISFHESTTARPLALSSLLSAWLPWFPTSSCS